MKLISDVIKRLLQREPYYGLFLCGINKEYTTKIETAGVSKDPNSINYRLLVNKDWFASLSPENRYGIIKHEALHLIFYHVLDHKDFEKFCPDHNLLNICMDLEVESYIDPKYSWSEGYARSLFQKFPSLPKGIGVKKYYKFMQSILDPPQPQMSSCGCSGGNGKSNSSGDEENDSNDTSNNMSETERKKLQKTLEDMLKNGDHSHDNWGEGSDAERQCAKSQLDYMNKQTAKNIIKDRGLIPNELKALIEKLLTPPPPVVNWKAFLRRFFGFSIDVRQKKTRRKESLRFEENMGSKRLKKHNILVAIDTSGSVDNQELAEFFSEIYHIYKAGANIKILECDAQINKEYDYKGKTPQFVTGRGGTSFLPVIEYYNSKGSKYNTLVYFTDGYGENYSDEQILKPKKRMLWVITSSGMTEGLPGAVIQIPKQNK